MFGTDINIPAEYDHAVSYICLYSRPIQIVENEVID